MKMAIFLLVASAAALAQSESDNHNGYWWNHKSEQEKLIYLEGYTDGVSAAAGVSGPRGGAKLIYKMTGLDNKSATFGQFLSGLDHFYSDYRNVTIPTGLAVEYVSHELRGVSENELANEIRIDRKIASTTPDH